MGKNLLLAGNNRPEDVRWLFSLSESELDMMITLKKLAIRRAEIAGHVALAKKFDLKVLRELGFVLMQHVKKQVSQSSIPALSEAAKLLDASNLLKLDLKSSTTESKSNEGSEENSQKNTRKRMRPNSGEASKTKRQKNLASEAS